MVVWQGWGILTVIITALILVATQAVAGAQYYSAHPWVQFLGLLASGALVGVVGYILNSKPGRTLIDPNTNQAVVLKSSHTLFWIPMQYWSIILVVIGVAMFFV